MTNKLWVIRPIEDTDRAFIIKSWLQSYSSTFQGSRVLIEDYLSRTNPTLGGQIKDAFFQEFHSHVEEMLGISSTLVAVMADEPTVILGFINGLKHNTGPMVLNFVYVRARYRNLGIAKSLFNAMLDHLSPTDPQLITTAITPFVKLQSARKNAVTVPIYTFLNREKRESR